MALPGTEDYLVELEVYHQLHCLNVLRKLLYPERYHLLERVSWKNGTINRESYGFKHWGEKSSLTAITYNPTDTGHRSLRGDAPADAGLPR